MNEIERAYQAGVVKRAKELTESERTDFAVPKEKKYPIPDVAHARNALARVSQFGSSSEKEKVRAAVRAKFPSIDEGGEEKKGALDAADYNAAIQDIEESSPTPWAEGLKGALGSGLLSAALSGGGTYMLNKDHPEAGTTALQAALAGGGIGALAGGLGNYFSAKGEAEDDQDLLKELRAARGKLKTGSDKTAGMEQYVEPTALERVLGGGAGVLGGGLMGKRIQGLTGNEAPYGHKNLGALIGGAAGGTTGLVAPSAGGALGGAGLGMLGGRALGKSLGGEDAEYAGNIGELLGGAAGAVGGGRLMELLEQRRLQDYLEANRGR